MEYGNMSDQSTISTLLWALKEVGVEYKQTDKPPPWDSFFLVMDPLMGQQAFPDAVSAAREMRKQQRRYEVLADQQYPQLISELVQKIRTALPCLKPSNMVRWKKQLEELIDETEASLHSSQAR
jgi:hypothetical protein